MKLLPPWPQPIDVPGPCREAIKRAYVTPRRAYHNFTHVWHVLDHYASVDGWEDPGSVALAVLFHDAVYEAGRADNETRSAELARQLLQAHPLYLRSYDIDRVTELIMLTARHGTLTPADVDHDEAHFLDCDMAILGADRPRFGSYEYTIRLEYLHVPEEAYREGRSAFLRRLLALPSIFLSETFRERGFEARARDNVAWALETVWRRASPHRGRELG